MSDPTQDKKFNDALQGLLKQSPKTHDEMISERRGNSVSKRRPPKKKSDD